MIEPITNLNGEPAPEQTTPPAATPPPLAPPEKTFTQVELDAILKDRLKREKDKYQDYDAFKAAADELARIKESQLSEQQKLEKRLNQLEAAKTQAESLMRETLIRSAFVSEAAKLGFHDPEDAYRLADLSAVKMDENGKLDGVAEAVKALAESRKYLIKSSNPALSTFNPAGPGSPQQETDAQRRTRIYGGGGSFFDSGRAEQHGGGVVWPKGEPEQ